MPATVCGEGEAVEGGQRCSIGSSSMDRRRGGDVGGGVGGVGGSGMWKRRGGGEALYSRRLGHRRVWMAVILGIRALGRVAFIHQRRGEERRRVGGASVSEKGAQEDLRESAEARANARVRARASGSGSPTRAGGVRAQGLEEGRRVHLGLVGRSAKREASGDGGWASPVANREREEESRAGRKGRRVWAQP